MTLTSYIWSFTGKSPASKTLLSWKLVAAATKWIRLLSQTSCFQLLLCCTLWAALPAETTPTWLISVYCAHRSWPAQISPSGAEVLSGIAAGRHDWNDAFHNFWWFALIGRLCAGTDSQKGFLKHYMSLNTLQASCRQFAPNISQSKLNLN